MKTSKEITLGGFIIYRAEDGRIHNEEPNPAIIWPDGSVEYYYYGKRHSTTGPAIVYANGRKIFYLYDEVLSIKEWCKRIKLLRRENRDLY